MKLLAVPTALFYMNAIVSCLAQSTGTSQPPGLESIVDQEKGKDLINYWKDYGCFALSDNSEPNVKEQCKEACFPGGVTSDVPASSLIESSQTCWLNGPESDYRTGKELTEDQKKENPRTFKSMQTGYCTCNDPIIDIGGDFFMKSVIEAGKILTKIMCPTLQALDIVVEIGSAAIPGVGKAITVGMKTRIKTTNMFKYGYEAEEAAMEWASMFVDQGFGLASEAGCESPFKFSKADLAKRFMDLSDAPDELVPGINYNTMPCPKGKNASKKCKKRSGDRDDSNTTSKSKDADRSASTSIVSSTISSSATPSSTADCAAIGRRDSEDQQDSYPELEDGPVREDTGVQVRSAHLQARTYAPKKGDDCGVKFWSNYYPTSGEEFMEQKLTFGYSVANDCSHYDWEAHAGPNNIDGDTEHVLDWSMVRGFFDAMNSHDDFKLGFQSPDPEVQKNVKFCEYWEKSWNWPDKLGMPNPDITAPGPPSGEAPVRKTPFKWFAEAYPFIQGSTPDASRAHQDEFVILQKKINQGAKNRMFSNMELYEDSDMSEMIQRKCTRNYPKTAQNKKKKKEGPMFGKPHEQPRIVIQRMRSMVGAYMYLKDKRINTIFGNQVNRIGQQLERLEQALPNNPRIVDKTKPKRQVTYTAWKYQGLEKKWYKYMDDVYERANKKAQEFMTVNLKRLKAEYMDGKMLKQSDVDKEKDKDKKEAMRLEKELREAMKGYIEKLEKEWEKTKDWSKPKWNT